MTDNRPAGLCAWLLALCILLLILLVVAPASANPPGPVAAGQEVHAAAEDTKDQGDAGKATDGTEPSTWLLLGAGLAAILLFHHQRQRRRHHQRQRHRSPPVAGHPSPVVPPASR